MPPCSEGEALYHFDQALGSSGHDKELHLYRYKILTKVSLFLRGFYDHFTIVLRSFYEYCFHSSSAGPMRHGKQLKTEKCYQSYSDPISQCKMNLTNYGHNTTRDYCNTRRVFKLKFCRLVLQHFHLDIR